MGGTDGSDAPPRKPGSAGRRTQYGGLTPNAPPSESISHVVDCGARPVPTRQGGGSFVVMLLAVLDSRRGDRRGPVSIGGAMDGSRHKTAVVFVVLAYVVVSTVRGF